MQTQDDDFPYTSDDPSLAPAEDKNAVLSLTPQQVGDLKAALRLVVGSSLTGKDVFVQRLRKIQAAQEPVKPVIIEIDENETFRDQLKYLLLGILFETPDLIQRSLESVEHGSSKIIGLISKLVSPITNSWLFSPVKEQVDYAAARGERVIDRLIMKGRIEEQHSRLMLQQQAINDLLNDVVEYVIQDTEVRQIIQEQSINVAGDVVGEFQEQSAAVDTLLEGKLKTIFRKRPPQETVTPPSNQPEKG
jgi:hypothetical protein